MSRITLTRSAGLALGWFLVALAASSEAHAYCRLTTEMPLPGITCSEQGIGLAWRRQCISFSMMSRKPADPPLETIRNVGDVSFKTWTDVSCNGQGVGLQVRQTEELGQCAVPEYNTHAPNANTIIFVEDWSARALPPDAFGLTLVWHNPDTGEIYDADMQLNETLGKITVCDKTCSGNSDIDLQNVMTHEAGHFLGLGHSGVLGSTMSSRATLGETSKRDLADDDKQGLCSIYGSLPAAACQMSDFVPNHGFATTCAPADGTTTGHGLKCSVSEVRGGRPVHVASAFLLLLSLLYLVRPRRWIGRSSDRPSPTNR